MKKILFLILLITIFITSCTYQANERPKRNDNEIWICKEPYLELYWTESKYGGKLVVDEKEYDIVHTEDHGAHIYIYENAGDIKYLSYKADKYRLFRGIADYGKEKMTLTVDVDYKNVFGGEKPTFELIKHNKNQGCSSTVFTCSKRSSIVIRKSIPAFRMMLNSIEYIHKRNGMEYPLQIF